jgi:AcrR family transcriptional regulator
MAKDGARERILATASRLFYERGYSEVGINEIIESSDTAKATFYHHFPSKQTLCHAWLESVHDRWESIRRSILEAPGDPLGKVETFFTELGRIMEQSQFRGCPYTNTAVVVSAEETCLARAVQTHKMSLRDFFRDLALQVLAEKSPADAVALGDTLFLLYSGATTEAQNLRSLWPVETAKTAALEICRNHRG